MRFTQFRTHCTRISFKNRINLINIVWIKIVSYASCIFKYLWHFSYPSITCFWAWNGDIMKHLHAAQRFDLVMLALTFRTPTRPQCIYLSSRCLPYFHVIQKINTLSWEYVLNKSPIRFVCWTDFARPMKRRLLISWQLGSKFLVRSRKVDPFLHFFT